MTEGWTNCTDCGQRYKWGTPGSKATKTICGSCCNFNINIGPMDWRLLQCQRACIEDLAHDERLTEIEQEVIQGVQALLDFIHDEAKSKGRNVPSLAEIVLDRLSEL